MLLAPMCPQPYFSLIFHRNCCLLRGENEGRECWKPVFAPPYQFVFSRHWSYISRSDLDSRCLFRYFSRNQSISSKIRTNGGNVARQSILSRKNRNNATGVMLGSRHLSS